MWRFSFSWPSPPNGRAARGQARWLRTSLIYTLSLSVYCIRLDLLRRRGLRGRGRGLEYLTIYLGPTLVMVGWWWSCASWCGSAGPQRTTSIADSRVLALRQVDGAGRDRHSLLAVVGTTPYIALQLQSVSLSMSVLCGRPRDRPGPEATSAGPGSGSRRGSPSSPSSSGPATSTPTSAITASSWPSAVEAVVKLVALYRCGRLRGLGTRRRHRRDARDDRREPPRGLGARGRTLGGADLPVGGRADLPAAGCSRCSSSRIPTSVTSPPPPGPSPSISSP